MMVRGNSDSETIRTRIVVVAMLFLFIGLGCMLWHIQVAQGHIYEDDLARQSVRRIRVPGMRGLIYDRNGERLADNQPNYGLAIYLEELRQPGAWSNTINHVETLVTQLSTIIGRPPEVTRDDIWAHIRRRLPLPLLVWRGLDEQTLARWAERSPGIPGVDIHIEPVRVYPNNETGCHLLGYVGRAEITQDKDEPYHYYVPEMQGKAGVEKKFDDVLRGEAGGRLVRVDVSGYRHDDIAVREPKAGHDLQLAMDLRIQQLLQSVLQGVKGAGVVLDPSNGDVLALASSPGFDPNVFVPRISTTTWNALIQNPGNPLLNRAAAGCYAPGSTFKPVVAMAALQGGKANASTVFNCPGYLMLGRHKFKCWYSPGHGVLNMQQALRYSCNVYFYRLGLLCGHKAISHMAMALGLGRKTGADIDYERAGLVPDEAWKRQKVNDAWRDGDTCNFSIGQGALAVTPLQMAVVVSAIANGGYVYRPRIALGLRAPDSDVFITRPVKMVNDMHWSPEALHIVRQGMKDVIMSPDGSGRNARIEGVSVAGKTGTAEYGRKGSGKKYGWMLAFAPFKEPRYAIAMVVEEAVSGGVTVGPRIHDLLEGIFSGRDLREGAG